MDACVCCGEGYRVGGCSDRGFHGGIFCVEGRNFGDYIVLGDVVLVSAVSISIASRDLV